MPSAPATLAEFVEILSGSNPDAAAVFHTQSSEIGRGYHITELKLADVQSIDCGGRQNRWQEAQLQLLDGQDGARLTVGKVASILTRSRAAIPALADVPLSVEFAPGNRGLQRYRIGVPETAGDRMRLPLIDERAQCKPAVEMACCGAGSGCGG